MPDDAAPLLDELGFTYEPGEAPGTWWLSSPAGIAYPQTPVTGLGRITTLDLATSPTPAAGLRPLFVGRTATRTVLQRARGKEVDVLVEDPLHLVLRGTEYWPTDDAAPPARRIHRTVWTRWGLRRCLLLAQDLEPKTVFAAALGASQGSIAKARDSIHEFVVSTRSGLAARNKTALLRNWMEVYPGPGGRRVGWRSPTPIAEQTLLAASAAARLGTRSLISGDVAADRLAPSTPPRHGLLYVEAAVDLSDDGFVPVPLDEATLVTCVPDDPTLWSVAAWAAGPGAEPALADTAIVYRDLLAGADAESIEAAERVRRLLLGTAA